MERSWLGEGRLRRPGGQPGLQQFKYVLAVAVSVIAVASTGAVAQQPPSAISGAQKLMVVPASKYSGHVYVLPATLETTQWGWFDNAELPRLVIDSGDTVVVETMSHSHGQLWPGRTIEELKKLRTDWPGRGPMSLTGPIFVNGAEPGDSLRIKIQKIVPRPWGANFNIPGMFGEFPKDFPDGQVKYFYLDGDQKIAEFAPGIIDCHAGSGERAHGIGGDAVAAALERNGVRQPDNAGLRCRIVALADRALEGVRREVDNPAEALAAHQLDGVVAHVPRALEVHADHGVEVVLGHVPDHALAQHASRIDNEIDLAERIRALAHHAAGAGIAGDRVVVGERRSAGFGDFHHHFVGRTLGRDLPAAAGAGVVDDDAGAFPAMSSAMPRPMPRPAPVMTPALPSRFI